MKRLIVLILVLAGILALTCGMSGLGGPSATVIPEPDENYTVTVIDKSLVSAPAWNVTCDGDTFLVGLRGKAQVAIDFEKIQAVDFVSGDQGFQNAAVLFWDGSSHEIKVKNMVRCSGRTDIGIMQIKVRDIHRIEFIQGTKSTGDTSSP
ncbi:MAG: hypothetical protein P9M14_04650 [Candidatus Alcyoniella australis]|nr:hypothetical protein [Candidatus Alcyoniella australis]